mgnify:CR=1 FL=1
MKCNFPIYHVRNRIFIIMSGMSLRFKIEMIEIGYVVVGWHTLGLGNLLRILDPYDLRVHVHRLNVCRRAEGRGSTRGIRQTHSSDSITKGCQSLLYRLCSWPSRRLPYQHLLDGYTNPQLSYQVKLWEPQATSEQLSPLSWKCIHPLQ